MTFTRMPRGGKFCIKLISIFLIPTFILSNLVYASPTADSAKTPTQNITVTNPETIVIPREFGLVKSKFTGKNDRLVIHIQDAHCNYEAQTNIVKILENLNKNYNVSLISVEGADGVIDTSWFKAFPDDEVRKEVADYFMKKGEITGPEFLSITTDYNIKLFGAETRSYYIDNLNAFTSSYPLKAETEKYLNSIRSALNRLKTYIYSEDLRLMDAKYQDYESKKLAFNDYVKFLQVEAEKAKINLRAYDNFFKLVSVLIYEKKIDFTVTDKERGSLIDNLSKAVSKEALTELVNKSLGFKTGKISSADYYAYLKKLAIDNETDLAKDYPNLYNYIIYNSVYSKIENEKLFNDIKKLEGDIKEKLFTNDDQRALEKLSRHIDILIGLVNIKLLNGDYEYFEGNKAEFTHEIFSDFLKKKTVQYGLAYEMDEPNDAVAKALPKLEDFYAIAIKRDKALVDNTLGQMNKDKMKVAVLVTGGFHSEGMAKLLEEQGVSYMVVCPSITKDLPTPYIQILTNQKTPLTDILVSPVHASEGGSTDKGDALAPPLRTELVTMNEGEFEAFLKAVQDSAGLKAAVEGLENDWYKISVNGRSVANVQVVKGYVEHMRNGVGGVSGSTAIIVDNMMKGLKANLDKMKISQAARAKIRAAVQDAVSQIPSLQNSMVEESARKMAQKGRASSSYSHEDRRGELDGPEIARDTMKGAGQYNTEAAFRAKSDNLSDLRQAVKDSTGVEEVIAITNGGDDQIVQDTLVQDKAKIFRGDGAVKIYTHPESTRRGQFLGLLDAMREYKKRNGDFNKNGVSLGIMMPGKGTRTSPLTQRKNGIKPFIEMLMRSDSSSSWLTGATASLYTWNLVAVNLRRMGFRGIAWKWGDEPQFAANRLNDMNMDLSDADIVRFGSKSVVTSDLAENKEWLDADDNGTLTGWARRRDRSALLDRLGVPNTPEAEAKVHIGSPAFSYLFIDKAMEAFADVPMDKWIDVDGFLIEALRLDKDSFLKEKGVNEVLDQCPDFWERCQRLKAEINKVRGRAADEKLTIKVIDFGKEKDFYWGDIGQLSKARQSLYQLAENNSNGEFARQLAAIGDVVPDEFGNRVIGDCVYPKDGSVRNSILIDTKIYGKCNISEAVLVSSVLGMAKIDKGSVVYGSTVIDLTMGEKAFSFNSAKEKLVIDSEWVHTSMPKDLNNIMAGLDDWRAPAYEVKLENGELSRFDPKTDDSKAKLHVGSKGVYDKPVWGNPCSFEEQQKVMRQRAVAPAQIEAEIQNNFGRPIARAAMKYATAKRISFGTSGLRGLDKDMADEEIYINTRGFIEYLFSVPVEKGGIRPGDTIDIAADFRPSSKPDRIPRAVAAAIVDSGCKVDNCGNVSTPAVTNYAMNEGQKNASIMVTASHNPYYFDKGYGWNGIKFNRPNGEILKFEEESILAAVDSIRIKEYMKPASRTLFKDDGWFKPDTDLDANCAVLMREVRGALSSIDPKAESTYVERYVNAFGKVFDGQDVLVYQHTAVGRELIARIFEELGANVTRVGLADENTTFKAVDTEDIKDWVYAEIKEEVKKFAKANNGRLPFAIVTADGDSDRPAVFYVVAETGGDFDVVYISGNKLGILTSLFLRPDFVALTATADNAAPSALKQNGINAEVSRTKVGSPHVNKVMIDEIAKRPSARCVAFEGNGGYLIASNIDMSALLAEQFPGHAIGGGILKALPTRDAVLPMIATLLMAKKAGSVEKFVEATFVDEAKGYAEAALIENDTLGCEAYTADMGKKIIASITPVVAKGVVINAVSLKDGTVIIEEAGKSPVLASTDLAIQMTNIVSTIESYLSDVKNLGEISRIEYIDGVRIYFTDKFRDIVHLRPSGNAPQFRVYSEANDPDRAKYLVESRLNFMPAIINKFTAPSNVSGALSVAAEKPSTKSKPGGKAVAPNPADNKLIETTPEIRDVEKSLNGLFTNFSESELLSVFELDANHFIKSYTKIVNKDKVKEYFRLVAKRALYADGIDYSTSRGLQIMAGQALAIISLIEDGMLEAGALRLTVSPNDMLKAEDKDRGLSYISAQSVIDSGIGIANAEGATSGIYWRGVEGVTKLGAVLNDQGTEITRIGPNISAEAIYDKADFTSLSPKMVMYIMLHVGGYHTTVFLHDYIPGTIQHTSTGPGHFQGEAMDVKYVVAGRGIQLNKTANDVIAQRMDKGSWAVANPNHVDEIVNLGGLIFKDFSTKVSGVTPQKLTPTAPYSMVSINGREVFAANSATSPAINFSAVKAPEGSVSIRDLYVYGDEERYMYRPKPTPSVEVPVIASPEQVERAAQIAKARQYGVKAEAVRINLAWGTEDWRNSIHVDPSSPGKYISPIAGSSMTLLELMKEAADIFGEEFVNSPYFTKILDTGNFPKVVYVGLKPGVNKEGFARLLNAEQKHMVALLGSLKLSIPKGDFDSFKEIYSQWATEQAKADWKASGLAIDKLVADMSVFVDQATGQNFARLMSDMAGNRAAIVSNLNKIDLTGLTEDTSILCRTDTIHAIFGLSLQVHGPAGEKGTEKNEAWVVTQRGGRIVLEEPQQVSNTTHSIADFFTPLEWEKEGAKPGLRKTDIAEKIDTANPKSVINNNVNFNPTPLGDIVIHPVSTSRSGSVEKLSMIDREDWPYFRSEVIRFADDKGRSEIATAKDTSMELSVFGAGVMLQIGSLQVSLNNEDTYIIPAGNAGPVVISAKGKGEVRIYSKPVAPLAIGAVSSASDIIAVENNMTGDVRRLSLTLNSKQAKDAVRALQERNIVIINAVDTGVEENKTKLQMAVQEAQSLISQGMGSNIINIRGAGEKLLEDIANAVSSHPGAVVVTTTHDKTIAEVATQFGNVINVQQAIDKNQRYMPVPGLQNLAMRVAIARVIYAEDKYSRDRAGYIFQALNMVAVKDNNSPFTMDDVMRILSDKFWVFKILPRIVPVDLAAAREAYIAAQAALKSL